MPRLLSDDTGLWQLVTRDVVPLRLRPPVSIRRAPVAALKLPQPAQPKAPPVRLKAPVALPPLDQRNAGVDRATAERVKRGRYPVEARLDLHGLTQAEAHTALAHFVVRSRNIGRRCVLVITGHGRITGGILKAAVPRWLGETDLRPHLLAVTPAQPRDGGTAALYLLLRRLPREA
ncbi:MAG TPA: Smr/MutS family protein [Stellaceae bacterium]|jgi:DNA-nicking Smr family endonuclease|nr:Smr/MutS family protein [Stellaceae bacterium]